MLPLGEHGGTGGVVGAPGVGADQPLPHELLALVPELGGTLQVGVGQVELVQVDVVGAETLQRCGERAAGVLRGVVGTGEGAGLLVEDVAPLGGEDHVVPALAERAAEDAFAVPRAVGVGGVEERDTQIEGAPDRPYGLLVVDLAPAERLPARVLPLPADGPAAEAESAHVDTAAAEGPDVRLRLHAWGH